MPNTARGEMKNKLLDEKEKEKPLVEDFEKLKKIDGRLKKLDEVNALPIIQRRKIDPIK